MDAKFDFSEKTLTSFAKALAPEIREFYQSEEGQRYFEQWLKRHPEYSYNSSAHSTESA
jgi:hypothetical protein